MKSKVESSLMSAVAAAIRDAADRLIMPRFARLAAHEIETKSQGEIVTAVDHAMEQALTETLQRLEPGARIVGEEAVELGTASLDRLDEGRVWLVDPLDGTANFAEGRGPFGVIVALIEDGATLAGWLYDPQQGVMAATMLGGGSFLDERRIAPSPPKQDRLTVAIAGQFLSDERNRRLHAAVGNRTDLAPIPRCAAAHYPMIADGRHDVAVFQRTLPWDHAGGALFLTEAGGRVSRWNGEPYRIGDTAMGIVAARSAASWDVAMAMLGSELATFEAEIGTL